MGDVDATDAAQIRTLVLHDGRASQTAAVRISTVVIAGWTGRDATALAAHLAELEQLGVARPSSTPLFYRVAASRLTTVGAIEVAGQRSSGEVEFVLLQTRGRLWVGLGSDHTDREVERYDVTVSKQVCDKPIAPEFWAFDDVRAHWDRLVLRSLILEQDRWRLYQEGPVTALRDPGDLIARCAGEAGLADGTLLFGGTLPAIGGVTCASRFRARLEDPILGRALEHEYRVITLPMVH